MRQNLFVFLSLMFIFVTSCQDKESLAKLEKFEAQSALEEQNKQIAERFHFDLSINRNWEAAEEFISDDIVIHMQGGSEAKGMEELKGFDEVWASMHNAEINHYEIIAEGDHVFVRWDVAYDDPSGNHVSGIFGMDLFLIKDGKITEMWQNYDEVGLLKQIGALPAE
jgi:predicted SnoaL-like aldol condensation-catalyzing enzyme